MTTILLVEDNDGIRRMVTRRLVRLGFEVVGVGNGLASLDAARERAPDLVLMDLALPGVDGLEATRRLKADGETQHLPVIALTAHAMGGKREEAMAAGCSGFVAKPIDFAELHAQIRTLVPS